MYAYEYTDPDEQPDAHVAYSVCLDAVLGPQAYLDEWLLYQPVRPKIGAPFHTQRRQIFELRRDADAPLVVRPQRRARLKCGRDLHSSMTLPEDVNCAGGGHGRRRRQNARALVDIRLDTILIQNSS